MMVVGHNFAEMLAHLLGARFVDVEKRTFPDGEICPRILTDSADKHSIIAERMTAVEYHNRYLIEVLFNIKNLRDLGAERIDVVMPYFIYCRQNRVFRLGESFSAKFILEVLADAGATRFFTVSPHCDRDKEMISFSPIPAYNINGFVAIAEYVKGLQLSNPIIIGPDEGAKGFVKKVSGILNYDSAVFKKERNMETGAITMHADFDLRGKDVVILDDIVSSGTTLLHAIDICKKSSPRKIYCAAVHVLSEKAIDAVSPLVDKFVSCNTVHSAIAIIPVEKLVAEKIKELSQNI